MASLLSHIFQGKKWSIDGNFRVAGCGFVFYPHFVQDTSPESNDATLWDDIDVGYLPAAINFVKFDFLNRTGLQKGRFIVFFLPTMLSHMFRAKTWIIDANFRVELV